MESPLATTIESPLISTLEPPLPACPTISCEITPAACPPSESGAQGKKGKKKKKRKHTRSEEAKTRRSQKPHSFNVGKDLPPQTREQKQQLLPGKPFYTITKPAIIKHEGRKIGASFSQVLDVVYLRELMATIEERGGEITEKLQDARGDYTTFHLGYWTTPGGKTHNGIYRTEASYTPFGKELIPKLAYLAKCIGPFIREHFPDESAYLLQVAEPFREFDHYGLAVVNVQCGLKLHQDRRDVGICAVIPLGEFEGGALGFSEFNLGFGLKMGDFALFYSMDYYHSAMPFIGRRMSIVFATKQKAIENAQLELKLREADPLREERQQKKGELKVEKKQKIDVEK